jgi:hypothetical protein
MPYGLLRNQSRGMNAAKVGKTEISSKFLAKKVKSAWFLVPLYGIIQSVKAKTCLCLSGY